MFVLLTSNDEILRVSLTDSMAETTANNMKSTICLPSSILGIWVMSLPTRRKTTSALKQWKGGLYVKYWYYLPADNLLVCYSRSCDYNYLIWRKACGKYDLITREQHNLYLSWAVMWSPYRICMGWSVSFHITTFTQPNICLVCPSHAPSQFQPRRMPNYKITTKCWQSENLSKHQTHLLFVDERTQVYACMLRNAPPNCKMSVDTSKLERAKICAQPFIYSP